MATWLNKWVLSQRLETPRATGFMLTVDAIDGKLLQQFWSNCPECTRCGNISLDGWNRVGVALLSRKPVISVKRGKIGPRLLLITNRSRIRAFDFCENQWRQMTLKAIMHSVSKRMRLSEPTTKIWMKIDPCYQRQRCGQMALVSGNISFMQIFAGVPWRRGVKRQWGNRKRRFSGLSTLRLRHLRKP